jgi:Tfp pilus assembly protein PilX
MFMALLILIVLSLLAVFGTSSGILQERMTGNFRDSARAFEAAEAGARWVEAWFASQRNPDQRLYACDGNCVPREDTIWAFGNLPADVIDRPETWWQENGIAYGEDPATFTGIAAMTGSADPMLPQDRYLAMQPRMLVEQVHLARDSLEIGSTGVYFYRITARAGGAVVVDGEGRNVAIVRSTFARRYE